MKDLIRESLLSVVACLRNETDEVVLQRLEALYLEGVENSAVLFRKMIEGLEMTATRNAHDYARLVDVLIDAKKFSDEELAMLRSWFAELSDGSILKLQQSNPAVHDSVMAKITQVKKQEVVAA